MQDNPLISVIIPVYNVEDFLDKCIQSVINQDYKNLEIILVDDGSTDSSGSICNKYASEDSRIVVMHQKNAGQSAARNNALKIAKGNYIAFIDSDDFWDSDCISFLLNLIISNNAQLSISAVRHLGFPEQLDFTPTNDKIYTCSGHDIARNILLGTNGFTAAAHHSLFEASICKKHFFIEGVIYEDLEYMINLSFDIDKAVTSKLPKYNYVYRKNNSSSAASLKRKNNLDLIISKINDLLLEKAPELMPELRNRYISNLICLIRSLHHGEHKVYSILKNTLISIPIDKNLQTKSNYMIYNSIKYNKLCYLLTNGLYILFRKIRYILKSIKNLLKK